ncbi:MAG: tetratricopeptide repeat protein [Chitinivibrionia bacterium]|nr:tetratricopeptide repeat protein [Chitinivibrionia bacterium]
MSIWNWDPLQSPTADGCLYYIGLAQERLGRLDEALASYEKSIELDRRWLPHYIFYYLALHRAGRSNEAQRFIEALSDSLKSAEPLPAFEFWKRTIEFYAGRLPEHAFFKAAKAENPGQERANLEEVYFHAGMAYLLGLPIDLESSAPDTAKAEGFLRKCAGEPSSGTFDFSETQDMARTELKRLGDR